MSHIEGLALLVDLRDYTGVLRKRWITFLAVVAACLGIAVLTLVRATPTYQASVKFFVSTPASTGDSQQAYTGGLFSQQRVKSYADLLQGPKIAELVAEQPGIDLTADQVQATLGAQAIPDTVLLVATVTDTDPARAARIADTVGQAFPGLVEGLERPAGTLVAPIRIVSVENARTPTSQTSPRPQRTLAIALFGGLALGLALAFGREALDSSIRAPADIEEVAGEGRMLGAIAFDSEATKRPLITDAHAQSVRAEGYRHLRTNLQFVDVDNPAKVIVVTSSTPAEGKSSTASNLAITMAHNGLRVLVIEADLRRPKLAHYMGVEGAVGLSELLVGKVKVDDVLQEWGNGLLWLLPSGALPPNPAELLGSRAMKTLLAQLGERFDVVLLDAPPLLPVTDAAVLTAQADGALVIVRSGHTKKEQLRASLQSLEAVGGRVLGLVLTFAPNKGPDAYRYGYGYTSARQAAMPAEVVGALRPSPHSPLGPIIPVVEPVMTKDAPFEPLRTTDEAAATTDASESTTDEAGPPTRAHVTPTDVRIDVTR